MTSSSSSNDQVRTLILRGSSATDKDLDLYRNQTSIKDLVKIVQEKIPSLQIIDIMNDNNNDDNKGPSSPSSAAGGNEYEIGCALRFISRCMVKSDDQTGRDQDAIVPRDDLLLLTNDNDSSLAVESFDLLATLFSGYVSQSSTGLIAIDGLQRLIHSVFVVGLENISMKNNNNNNKCDEDSSIAATTETETKLFIQARQSSLFKIIVSLFYDLRVQELPTMSRRNAIRVLSWLSNSQEAWNVSLACANNRINQEEEQQQQQQEGKTQSNDNSTSPKGIRRLECISMWLDLTTQAMTEERDPVNVLAVFKISLNIHNFLETEKLFIQSIAPKLLFSESEYSQWRNQQQQQQKNNKNSKNQEDASSISIDEDEQINEELIEELNEVVDNLFQVTSSYFPLQFAPAPGSSIKKETLIDNLHGVMSSKLFFSLAIPQVMHKLQSATSTITATQCLDVLERGINNWKNVVLDQQQSYFYSSAFTRQVCRRFLKELFPFFRAYIQSNVAGESQVVATRVVSTLSAAASAYDASWSSSTKTTTFTQMLKECSVLSKVMSVLPNPNPNDQEGVFLDAGLVHALGKESPLLSLIFAASILPLVGNESQRIGLSASVLAVLEMNSAPSSSSSSGGCCNQQQQQQTTVDEDSSSSSSCCAKNTEQQKQQQLGDSESPKAQNLRHKIQNGFFDDKSKQNLLNGFESVLQSATEILKKNQNNNSSNMTSIRAAADVVGSASCLLTRGIFGNSDSDEHMMSLLSEAVSALLEKWNSMLIFKSKNSANHTDESEQEFNRAISAAVCVCLTVQPELCSSSSSSSNNNMNIFSSSFSISASASSSNDPETLIHNISSALFDVLDGVVSQYPNRETLRMLTSIILQLRLVSSSSSSSSTLAVVDRSCLSPLAGIIVKDGVQSCAPFLKALYDTHHHHENGNNIPLTLLPFVSELALQIVSWNTTQMMTEEFSKEFSSLSLSSSDNSDNNHHQALFTTLFKLLISPTSTSDTEETITALIKHSSSSSHGDSTTTSNARFLAVVLVAILQKSNDGKSVQKILDEAIFSGSEDKQQLLFQGIVVANMLRLMFVLDQTKTTGDDTTTSTLFSKYLFANVLEKLEANKNDESSVVICELLRRSALSVSSSSSSQDKQQSSCCGGGSSSIGGGSGCCQTSSSSSASSSSSWQVLLAQQFFATLSSSSSSNTNQKQVSSTNLHRSIILLEAAQTYYGKQRGSSVFDEILLSQHKNLLKLNQMNDNDNNTLTTATTTTSSSSIYMQDCLTLLEWLLLTKNQEMKLTALNYLIFTEPVKGQILLKLADMVNNTTNKNTPQQQRLDERLRPLKILSEVGKNILEMCMEKRPHAKSFEAAVRSLVPEIAKKTQSCLGDKKRLIRSGAAECRNFWLLIPKQ